MKRNMRVSYIHLFVIAIILGIVGRTAAPRFTEASQEDKVSLLVDRLTEVRAHLDIYKACNDGNDPPTNSSASFERGLVTRLRMYEPMLERLPVNPFNGLNTVRFDGESAGTGKAGWRFDRQSGRFQADHDPDYSKL